MFSTLGYFATLTLYVEFITYENDHIYRHMIMVLNSALDGPKEICKLSIHYDGIFWVSHCRMRY